jgi:hypothetical protein
MDDESMFEELGSAELMTANGGWRCTFSSEGRRGDDDESSPSRRRSSRIFSGSRETEITIKVFASRGVELT